MEKQMSEIWKSVIGYEGLYEVSSLGNVRSVNWRGLGYRKFSPVPDRDGYLQITLTKNGKQQNARVHRLVAMAFVDNPENKPQVNHIDEDRSNNVASNLEWVTCLENNNHGTRNIRVSQSKRNTNCKRILQLNKNGDPIREWVSINEVERQLGYDTGLMSKCCKGKKKSAYGYLWKYAMREDE
jgi:hypothetical protein